MFDLKEYMEELEENIQEALAENNTYEAEIILKEGWTTLHNLIDDVRDAYLYGEEMKCDWQDVSKFLRKLVELTTDVANEISEPLSLGEYDDEQ
ncbi:TPA: hypothetical protein ACNABL_004766 [Escherichia coli]